MIYRLDIPPPAAARYTDRVVEIHVTGGGWGGPSHTHRVDLSRLGPSVFFEVDDKVPHVDRTMSLDAPVFVTTLTERNASGSRTNTVPLVPVPVGRDAVPDQETILDGNHGN